MASLTNRRNISYHDASGAAGFLLYLMPIADGLMLRSRRRADYAVRERGIARKMPV